MMSDVSVEIVRFPEVQIAYMEHQGPLSKLGITISKMIAFRKANGFSPSKDHRTYALFYPPNQSILGQKPGQPPEQRVELAFSVDNAVSDTSAGVKPGFIRAGRYARAQYQGPRENIPMVEWLVTSWLPNSGEEHTGGPVTLQFLDADPNTPSAMLLTDIYLPLKS
jgi:AraC family transcriptional regulator